MVPEQIEREIVIAAPPERVWAALTEAKHIGTWFGDAGAEVDLRPGGTMILHWKEHGAVRTTIEGVEPPRLFSYRWVFSDDPEDEKKAPRPDNSTLVEFTLTPEGDGTRLRVVESGWRNLALSEERRARQVEDNIQGWRQELDELRAYVQRLERAA